MKKKTLKPTSFFINLKVKLNSPFQFKPEGCIKGWRGGGALNVGNLHKQKQKCLLIKRENNSLFILENIWVMLFIKTFFG